MNLRALAEPPTLSAAWCVHEIATAVTCYPFEDGWSGGFVRDPVVRRWSSAMAQGAYDGWSGRGLDEGDEPDPYEIRAGDFDGF